ncbi:hypothetical protein OHA40_03940 [Nocardia sp. NBC_00508]|uniref:hypothetical protein n=1 Tax=Nocardia sp. NBC_00508 TaxID=2975992 RepID=UPI002E814247|nr:hypothetical protein [Nocardia sp. NBC_00508]WUD67319.1 hypothetical protein OHA40_03940 [Nocardia sp. NBC_00508]
MTLMSKLTTALMAAPVFATAIAAAPTALAQPMAPFQAVDMHRGEAGCFAWSWADGNTTTTVYWHNRCSTEKTLLIEWLGPAAPSRHVVPGDGKGHEKTSGIPHRFEQQ